MLLNYYKDYGVYSNIYALNWDANNTQDIMKQ